MNHKSEDYKLAAVKYYIDNKNKSMDEICEIFKCPKTSLKRWIDRYIEEGNINRHSREPISYKIHKKKLNMLFIY